MAHYSYDSHAKLVSMVIRGGESDYGINSYLTELVSIILHNQLRK